MQVLLENIRCFTGKNRITIEPLTIILGENSSGKSTFLACLACLDENSGYPSKLRFNEPPYSLGSFETIVSNKVKNQSHSNSFSLGYRKDDPLFTNPGNKKSKSVEIISTYQNIQGQIKLSELRFKSYKISFELTIKHPGRHTNLTVQYKKKKYTYKFDFDEELIDTKKTFVEFLTANMFRSSDLFSGNMETKKMNLFFDHTREITTSFAFNSIYTHSLSPIRTEPLRTYDQATDTYNPSGYHIPFKLARILLNNTTKENQKFIKDINKFGLDSGLFEEIKIKKFGSKFEDPFQIQIETHGITSNLIDVGYGVSQSLPVIIQCLLEKENSYLLMQQPEVHLHPKAQAALGTFFVDMVGKNNKKFVVETHSDYIVDRIRQEIAKGNISNELVSLLFFEKKRTKTTVHQIRLDKNGNVVDPPDSYRSFFLQEELNLLQRTL